MFQINSFNTSKTSNFLKYHSLELEQKITNSNAILNLLQLAYSFFDDGCVFFSIFLNSSKAFHYTDHNYLLQKL